MMKRPTISVIVPVYNAEKYVVEALMSIQKQNYQPLQLIVINDGSTDGSLQILQSLEMDMKLVSQENAGPAAARNRGLHMAQGDFVAFIDADDVWPDDKLQRQLTFLLDQPKVDIVWGRTHYYGDFGKREEKLPLDDQQTAFAYQLGAGLFRRAVFERVGLFDESLIYSEDYDWFLRAREMGVHQMRINEITLHHRVHMQGLIHAKNHMNYQLTSLVKKSLDRRRKGGEIRPLPKLPDAGDDY